MLNISSEIHAAVGDFCPPLSLWSWTYLSLGNIDDALYCAHKENDLLAWAASLALVGECWHSLTLIEAYIVSTCVITHDVLKCAAIGNLDHINSQEIHKQHNLIMTEWLLTQSYSSDASYPEHGSTKIQDSFRKTESHLDPANSKSEQDDLREYQHTVRCVKQLLSWHDLHIWYIIALTLFKDKEDAPYRAPVHNLWFQSFFFLPQQNVNQFSSFHLRQLDQKKTLSLLLAQCEEWEVSFISAITAYYTSRYRSTIHFASRFFDILHSRDSKANEKTLVNAFSSSPPRHYYIAMHFLRCRASLELGLRIDAAVDMFAFMKKTTREGNILKYVSMVGCALAFYGMPLVCVEKPLRDFLMLQGHNGCNAPSARKYVLAMVHYVHALTLLQLGEMQEAMMVAKAALAFSPRFNMREDLQEIITRAAVALEDSSSILGLPVLSAHHYLYISLCPAFFGDLSEDGLKAKPKTDVFEKLYPANLPLYGHLRQILPFHMNRAYYFFYHNKIQDAWNEARAAVAAADELVGSTEFVFTKCFPLQVYFFACNVGLMLLESFLESDVDACFKNLLHKEKSSTSSSLKEEWCAKKLFHQHRRSRCFSFTLEENLPNEFTPPSNLSSLQTSNEATCIEAIGFCRQWAHQIERYYPNTVLGKVAMAHVAIMNREPDRMQRALALLQHYPEIILSQMTWTFALYMDNYIVEASDVSEKNFSDFPHSQYVRRMLKWMKFKDMTFVFNYRTILPLRYGLSWMKFFTKRTAFSLFLMIIHVTFSLLIFISNVPDYIKCPQFLIPFVEVLTLHYSFVLLYGPICLLHAVLASTSSRCLVGALLERLYFSNSRMNRFLFAMRGVAFMNIVNIFQIYSFVDVDAHGVLATTVLCIFVSLFVIPFTSRMWFLPSLNEPNMNFWLWMTLLFVDLVTGYVLLVPHILFIVIEPFMALVYCFFMVTRRPTVENYDASVRQRLLYHEKNWHSMPQRLSTGSDTNFVYIKLMELLFYQTHPPTYSKHLFELQMEAENYRAFPLVDKTFTPHMPAEDIWLKFKNIQFPLDEPCNSKSEMQETPPVIRTYYERNIETAEVNTPAKFVAREGNRSKSPSISRNSFFLVPTPLYPKSEDTYQLSYFPIPTMVDLAQQILFKEDKGMSTENPSTCFWIASILQRNKNTDESLCANRKNLYAAHDLQPAAPLRRIQSVMSPQLSGKSSCNLSPLP